MGKNSSKTLVQDAKNTGVYRTMRHMETVRNYINVFVRELLGRGEHHDQSKLESPEVEVFEVLTPELRKTTYGSEEYTECLKRLGPALEHHYAKNRHHPVHFSREIAGMNLIDLMEMVADWKASSLRHDDGNILRSLEVNKERFHIDDQLYAILLNTVEWLDSIEVYHHAYES